MNTHIDRATGPASNDLTLYFRSPSMGRMIYLETGDRLVSADGFASVLNTAGNYVAQYDISPLGDRGPQWATAITTPVFAVAWDAANESATKYAQDTVSWRLV